MKPPHEYPEIIDLFDNPADPTNAVKTNPEWQLYDQDKHKAIPRITGITIHRLLADSFTNKKYLPTPDSMRLQFAAGAWGF